MSSRLLLAQRDFLSLEREMNGLYLGACLESIRWGSETSVLYQLSAREMIHFVKAWQNQNEGEAKNRFIPTELEEAYRSLELPYREEGCPRDKDHKKRIKDISGRERCGEIKEVLTEGDGVIEVADLLSDQMRKKRFYEFGRDPAYFEKPVNQESWIDPCYALIVKPEEVLALETILERKTIVKGLPFVEDQRLIFPFDGWTLAAYIKKWSEQRENPPYFKKDLDNNV